jgi:hypothetical protein
MCSTISSGSLKTKSLTDRFWRKAVVHGMSAPRGGTDVGFGTFRSVDDPGCVKTQKSKRNEE